MKLPTNREPISIIHGDNVAIMESIEDECIDHVICDPPYAVGAVHNTFNDEYARRDFQAATATWASQAARITKKDGWNISCMGNREDAYARFICGLEDGGWNSQHSPLVWIRRGTFALASRLPSREDDDDTPGYSPRQEFELVVTASKGKVHNHIERLRQNGKTPGNIVISQDPDDGWPFFDLRSYWPVELLPFIFCERDLIHELDYGLEGLPYNQGLKSFRYKMQDRRNSHQTPKPIRLMCYLLDLFTEPGDLILDPFLGAGSTAIACVLMGRRCIGIEQREEYCEISRRRVRAWTRRLEQFKGATK